MADRTILQIFKATTQGKKLCRHIQERSAVSIMDRINSVSSACIFKIQIKVLVVYLYAMFDNSRKSFCEAQPLGLAQRAIPRTEQVAARRLAVKIQLLLIWTAMINYGNERTLCIQVGLLSGW